MCRKTSEISERYEGMQVNVCFNYGGRDEIVRAARHFAADCAAGGRKPEELTEVPGIGEGILEGLIDYVTTGEENR